MGTVLKVGEPQVSTYRNMVTQPVPFASGHVTASYYSGNPNPNTTIAYMLDQLDGPTTRTYNQYLEDYARFTVPVLGAGTDEDPYYFYPYPVLTRRRVNTTAADFVGRPNLNLFEHLRAYGGVRVRMTAFWYNSANTQIYTQTGSVRTLPDSNWAFIATTFAAPPQSILNNVSYYYFGVEIVDGMNASQNYFDITGLRATPVVETNLLDVRGTYWDGSTSFIQPNYVSNWQGTPRSSETLLTVTELASVVTQTENAESISITEDVTGLDASAVSGGSAQATVTIPYSDEDPSYLGLAAEMQDTLLGNYYGRVRDTDDTEVTGFSNVTLDESMSLLNAWVTAKPQSGTLNSVLRNWVALAEAPVRGFVFEDGVGDIAVNVPGFVGNLYDKVRELLAAYGAELVTVNGTHIVRLPLQDKVILDNFYEPPAVRSNLQETAQYVRVHWYDNEYVTNGQVYPLVRNPQEAEEDVPEPTIYSVGAAEVLKVDIQMRASLLSVNNPTYVAFVPDEPVTGSGVYTAVGSDSLPITPAQWAAGGGALSVNISPDDPSVLQLTITGPDFPALAPFRIAMSSGSGNYYNALRLTGTGVFVRDQYVDLATGALPSATGQEFAVECTNPFIATETQAYQAGLIVAGRTQQAQTISLSLPTPLTGPVIGLLPGSKFVYGNQQFRIESTTVNHHMITVSGSYALTSADFDHYFGADGPLTSGEFDDLYNGSQISSKNFSLKPLLHRSAEV